MHSIVVSGHRDPDLQLTELLRATLPDLHHRWGEMEWPIWVLGDARGIDAEAKSVLRSINASGIVCKADWQRLGKAAGRIRNEQMLRVARREAGNWENVMVATFGRFDANAVPDFGGTAHMCRMAKTLGLVWVHNGKTQPAWVGYDVDDHLSTSTAIIAARNALLPESQPLPKPKPAPRVVHMNHAGAIDAVYVGRGSKWGNPFHIGPSGTRDQVVEKYHDYILSQPELLAKLGELTGRNLACWCAPKRCHADILLELANPTS